MVASSGGFFVCMVGGRWHDRSMKYRKTILFLAAVLALMVWREHGYEQSPQGKLDVIVASGRDSFEMREILGEGWKAVCFLPKSYNYPSIDPSNTEQMRLAEWLKLSLGREVNAKQDWGEMNDDGSGMKVLSDTGKIKAGLIAMPWQPLTWRFIKCTNRADGTVKIIRKDRFYWFEYKFERVKAI